MDVCALATCISFIYVACVYLFAEGDAILAVQDGAVDIQRGQFPQFSLIIARTVENGPAGYVAQRGACRVMVITPWFGIRLAGGGQEPTALPVNTNINIHKHTGIYMSLCTFHTQHSMH